MFAESLAPFFDTAALATPAVWSVGAKAVNGIFDSGYQAANLGAIAGVDGAKITFTCAAADVPTIAQGQTLTINAVVYTVRNVQPDGTGVVLLVLSKP